MLTPKTLSQYFGEIDAKIGADIDVLARAAEALEEAAELVHRRQAVEMATGSKPTGEDSGRRVERVPDAVGVLRAYLWATAAKRQASIDAHAAFVYARFIEEEVARLAAVS